MAFTAVITRAEQVKRRLPAKVNPPRGFLGTSAAEGKASHPNFCNGDVALALFDPRQFSLLSPVFDVQPRSESRFVNKRGSSVSARAFDTS